MSQWKCSSPRASIRSWVRFAPVVTRTFIFFASIKSIIICFIPAGTIAPASPRKTWQSFCSNICFAISEASPIFLAPNPASDICSTSSETFMSFFILIEFILFIGVVTRFSKAGLGLLMWSWG